MKRLAVLASEEERIVLAWGCTTLVPFVRLSCDYYCQAYPDPYFRTCMHALHRSRRRHAHSVFGQ